MSNLRGVATSGLLVLAFTSTAVAQQSAGELLQAGLYQEEVLGDIQQALALYARVLEEHPASRATVARALYRTGRCHEKLGAPEAQAAYERLVHEFGDQADVMALAEARLETLRNLAFNPTRRGFPHPLASDGGWGGGVDPWDLLDGIRNYPQWEHGLAFTGGRLSYEGESCGWRQVTVEFGEPRRFNRVVVWHHSEAHVPNTYRIESREEGRWVEVFRTADGNGRDYRAYPSPIGVDRDQWPWWTGWSTPTENRFPTVTGDAVRFALNNCDLSHGWLWSFEVYFDPPPIREVALDVLPGDPDNRMDASRGEDLRVAVLSRPDFDATMVAVAPLQLLGGATAARARDHSFEDSDGDGDLDLLLIFDLSDVGLACGRTGVELTGETTAGVPIRGGDTVLVVGCR